MKKSRSLRQKHEGRLGASAPFWLEGTVLGQFKFVMNMCAEDNKFITHILANLKDEEVMSYADVVYKLSHVLELNRRVIQEKTE